MTKKSSKKHAPAAAAAAAPAAATAPAKKAPAAAAAAPAADAPAPAPAALSALTSLEFVKRVAATEPVKAVAANETLNWYWNAALGLYEKRAPTLVKSSVDRVSTEVLKVADPLVGKYAPSIDKIGCQTLDTVEGHYAAGRKYATSTYQALDDKVVKPVSEPALKAYKTLDDKIVKPSYTAVDERVVKPVSSAYDALLAQTEAAVDKVLPAPAEDGDKAAESEEKANKVTLRVIGGRVSKRMQKRAVAQLDEIKVYTNKTFPHTVDLIRYAADNIDAGVNKSKELGQTGYQYAYSTVDYVKKADVATLKADAAGLPGAAKEYASCAYTKTVAAVPTSVEALKKQIAAAAAAVEKSSSAGAFAVKTATDVYGVVIKAVADVEAAGAKKQEDASVVRKYAYGLQHYAGVYAVEVRARAGGVQDRVIVAVRKFLGAVASSIEPVDSAAVPADTDAAAAAAAM